MSDEPAESAPTAESSPAALRLRAEGCRTLAEFSDTPEQKATWLERAAYWDDLAAKAAER